MEIAKRLVTIAAAAWLAAPAVQAQPEAEPGKSEDTRVITVGKSRINFYGFLRLDVIVDSDRPNSIQIPGFILSPDLNAPLGTAAGKSDFSMHPRLTRFGFDLEGAPVKGMNDAKLAGKLEIDFYNLPSSPTSLNSNSREFPRLRHAWLKLDWPGFSLLAGQREDLISPLAPTVNNDLVMWGAGNLGDRRPQVRAEVKSGAVSIAAMAGVTGAVDNQNSDASGNAFYDGEASALPTLQGRIGVGFDGPAAKKKSAIGVWAHTAREELDATATFANGRREFKSHAVGADLNLFLTSGLWLKAEAWTGKNLDDVRGGIFQGVVGGHEIEAKGGWAELGFVLSPVWTSILGISIDDPESEFLPRKTDTANPGQDKNLVWYIGNRARWGAVEMGADYLRWRTEFAGEGVSDGVDNRFNMFMAYHF